MTKRRILSLLLTLAMLAGLVTIPMQPAMASDNAANLAWAINPADANVSRIGPDKPNEHLLKLSNLSFGKDTVPLSGATLEVTFLRDRNSDNRKLAVWTDLCGPGTKGEAVGEVIGDAVTGKITFPTNANVEAGKIAQSVQIWRTDKNAAVTIPKSFLYDEATGKTATEIYIIFCLNSTGIAEYMTTLNGNTEGNRGGEPNVGFDSFGTVVLKNLNLGTDPNKPNLEWAINPADSNVSRLSSWGNLLKLDNLSFGLNKIPAGDATLQVNFGSTRSTSSNRKISVWTDLSGPGTSGESVNDTGGGIVFLTPANISANKIAQSVQFTPSALTDPANVIVTIPKELLYNATTGKAATVIYLTLNLNSSGLAMSDEGDNGYNGYQRGSEPNVGFASFETIKLSVPLAAKPVGGLKWQTYPAGEDANVSYMGSIGGAANVAGQVLKLSNLGFDPANMPTEGGNLEFSYRVAFNSSRRILVWTDLSGEVPAIEDYTFATKANMESGKIAFTASVLASNATSASVNIPQSLLYNSAADRYAKEIYVIITTDQGSSPSDNFALPGNQRGGDPRNNVNGINLAKEFELFEKIILNVPEPIEFATHITLTPGETPDKINFAWFTPKNETSKAALQLAKQSDLINGKFMPENPAEFIGSQAYGAYGYDTNKLTVSGLEKNTEYAYRVGDGNKWSSIYKFKTYDQDAKYNVIAVADPQIAGSSEGPVWRKTAEMAVAKANTMGGASFMMSAGDQTNYGSALDQMNLYLAPKELKSLPVMTTVGNHDNDIRDGDEPVALLPLIYNWPNFDRLAGASFNQTRGGGDYYFSYGNTLYISINTNVKETSIHRPVMERAIASHPDATWRVALFHHDIYGIGDHAGTGYGDSKAMQAVWSPFLDEFNIDIVFNGHDHIYARSMFMKNDEIQKYQMSNILDIDETNIFTQNAAGGVYIQPNGIQYIAMSGAGTKFYKPEYQEWVAYTPGLLNASEYSILTIDGDSLSVKTFRTDTDAMTDSITLRKKATFDDLQSLLLGCESMTRGSITESSWADFEAAIINAKAILSTAPADIIHDAYVALYGAYYSLDPDSNKALLQDLIEDVARKLAVSSEGSWAGQYLPGSKAILKAVLDEAIEVYNFRLASQSQINAAFDILFAAFETFLAGISDVPCPWIYVHEIIAEGVNTVGLIDWMKEGEPYYWGTDSQDRYHEHLTKQDFAGTSGGPRTEVLYGPSNAYGGRGVNDGYITKTHVGEWIRYELNVAQSGSYKVELGALNKTASAQKILLRDANYNTLCTFIVPANNASDWADAAMIPADKEIYLPSGNYIIELLFINNGVGPSNNTSYANGADVDILTFERTGYIDPPVIEKDPSIFILPLPADIAAGAAPRQQGWATIGNTDEWGNVANSGITPKVFKAATHLVLEVAGKPGASGLQLQLQSDADNYNWNQTDLQVNSVYSDGKLIFNLANMTGFEAFRNMRDSGRIFVSYYNQGWDELNVIKAYLILDLDLYPVDPCGCCPDCNEETCVCSDCECCKKEIVEYTVSFDINGSISEVTVIAGETVEQPENPEKDGYIFVGWYFGGEAFDFDTAVTENITLVAMWEKIPPNLISAIPSAYVTKLNGNKNDLTITVTEVYSDGTEIPVIKTFSIDNNSAGTYQVESYKVYVDTKGNTQIREIYILK